MVMEKVASVCYMGKFIKPTSQSGKYIYPVTEELACFTEFAVLTPQ
jgi:hypothetical protein